MFCRIDSQQFKREHLKICKLFIIMVVMVEIAIAEAAAEAEFILE